MKKVSVKGDIISNDSKWIYDWMEWDSTCPKDVIKILTEANGDDVLVEINSGGGDIFAGSEIYTALKGYQGNVEINIVGLAASAASVIAMAGPSKISPTALFMIHNVSSCASGDYNEMQKQADILQTANQSIANAYKTKTGLSDEQLLQMMNCETWLTAQQAVKKGFVDDVLFQNDTNSVSLYNSISGINPQVMKKLKGLLKENPRENTLDVDREKLNLMKIKGGYVK